MSLCACATAVVSPDDALVVDDAAAPHVHEQGDSSAPFKPSADSSAGDPDTSVDLDAGLDPDAANAVDSSVADSSVVDSGSLCPNVFKGVLATFDFTGEAGNQSSTAPKSAVSGVSAGNIGRSKALTAVTGAGSLNSSNWSTGALDGTRYLTFTIAADPKCTLDLTSLALDTSSSKTGPTDGAIATSDDAFAKTKSFVAGGSTSVALSVNGATGTVEVRIYGWNASSSGGTMRVQNTLSISGALH